MQHHQNLPDFNATGCRFPIIYEGLLSLYRRGRIEGMGGGGRRRGRGRMRRIKGRRWKRRFSTDWDAVEFGRAGNES
jgi:hypothetical protein